MLFPVRKLLFSLLFVAIGATLSSAMAQSNAKPPGVNQDVLSQIPQRMKSFIDQQTVAGAVTLVAHGNDVVEFDATGMADIEAGHPMRKDTIVQIMSMTKPVTATGIMMLAEEGKLALRDPVEQYLPEFRGLRVATTLGPDAERLRVPDHAITIRDLLTHTAGIQDYPGPPAIRSLPNSRFCFSRVRSGATQVPVSKFSAASSKSAPARSMKTLSPSTFSGRWE
jgi:CubicO group peptidase (beta-lactamase class C family)